MAAQQAVPAAWLDRISAISGQTSGDPSAFLTRRVSHDLQGEDRKARWWQFCAAVINPAWTGKALKSTSTSL